MGGAVCPWWLLPGSACGWTCVQVMECFVDVLEEVTEWHSAFFQHRLYLRL